ncbi:MAG TPA: deoxyribonuclease V [Nitrospiraceae bacterium]|nr:deoxyribonuclease V [Nitrospiraceae bacterium]
MNVSLFHPWNVTPQEAVQIQEQLRRKVLSRGRVPRPALVAGADAAFDLESRLVFAAVVVLSFPDLERVETVIHRDRCTFPYIPGLLSFRESPALLHAFARLRHDPDVIFIDGHGLSHPRSAGIACHIGISVDRPVIGCAKSKLTGEFREPGLARGATSMLYDPQGKVMGAVVRTRDRVKPVFVSVGHKISLAEAVRLTLACGRGYRIPEPTRQADLLAERAKKENRP